jgi:alpha-glucoside transport system substrate-binding protein
MKIKFGLIGLSLAACGLALAQTPQKTISVDGIYTGPEIAAFNRVVDVFQKANPDIKVTYTSSPNLLARIQAGDFPDIVANQQPGVTRDLAAAGLVVPMWDNMLKLMNRNYAPSWTQLSKAKDGKVYGLVYRVSLKGIVFYDKAAFAKAGFKAPSTWENLTRLTKRMTSTKAAPWCIGIGAGANTGAVGTDWLENIMLRIHPVGVYDDWINGKVKFDSPQVREAWKILDGIWGDPKQVYGGKTNIASTDIVGSASSLFAEQQRCWMHQQASFVLPAFPQAVQGNLDARVGAFVLPKIKPNVSNALEIGGDQYIVFKGKDRPEVRKFMEFLASPAAVKPWAQAGGALFPNRFQDLKDYRTNLERGFAQRILNAPDVRFDASNLMPGAVGISFFRGMTDWVTGKPIDDVLKTIDASYK